MPLGYLKKHWAAFCFSPSSSFSPELFTSVLSSPWEKCVFPVHFPQHVFSVRAGAVLGRRLLLPPRGVSAKSQHLSGVIFVPLFGRPYLLHGTTVDNLCLVAEVGLAVKSRGRWLGQISVPCVGSGGFVGLPRGSGKGCVCLCLGTESSWALQLF